MNLLRHRNNSHQNNEQIWHASFTSFHNSLTVSCAHICTASITWTSRTAQSRFTPVHTGYHSRNEMRSNASWIISSRLASWNTVVLLNGHPVLSSFPRRMAAFDGYLTSMLLTTASRGKLTRYLAFLKFCPSEQDTCTSQSWTSAWPTIPSSSTTSPKISVQLTRLMASIVIAFCLLASCKVLTFVKRLWSTFSKVSWILTSTSTTLDVLASLGNSTCRS